jgi:hypothetical protein
MRTFFVHPLALAIILAVVITCGLGAFLFVPIILINWGWNSLIAAHSPLPQIAVWQACLLYFAFVTSCFLLGFIRVEIGTEEV